MIRSILSEKIFFFLIIFYFILHLLAIFFPPVNFESLFAYAADYPSKLNKEELNIYFKYQANTLGFSYLIAGIKLLIPYLDNLLIGKIISCVGIVFFSLGTYNFLKIFNFRNYSFYIFFIISHPFIWTLSFRATPDFFSFALGFFSLTYLIYSKNKLMIFLSIILISASIIIKPHSLFFLIFYFFYLLLNFYNLSQKEIKKHLLIFCFIILISLMYFFFNYINFGFVLVNNNFSNIHRIDFVNFINNFILYCGYSLLIIFPLMITINLNFMYRNIKFFYFYFLLNFLFFFLGFFFIDNLGEMDFGSISVLFNIKYINGFLTLLFFNFFIFFNAIYSRTNNKFLFWSSFLSIVIFLFLLSSSRPSQRYLIYIIPFLHFLIFTIVKKNYLYFITFIFYLILNTLISLNHYATAYSSKDMIDFLKKNNINKFEVNYGHLFPHLPVIAQQSRISKLEKKYKIIDQRHHKFIFSSCKKFLIIKKCNYLINVED